MKKIPVILDTDIGTDIDDTWALAFLLKCPELDIKLITTATGDTLTRTKIVAKMLEIAGRTDIPIGIGLPLEGSPCYQRAWVNDYNLQQYSGQIIDNGIQAMIDTIKLSAEPVSVIAIAPLPNIVATLRQDPTITQNSRLVGMFGSIYKGYFGSSDVAAEYNVKLYPHACQNVFSTPWDMTIVPLDTCGILQLKDEKYQAVYKCKDVLMQAVIENYYCWTKYNRHPLYHGFDPTKESSILYDLLPIYLTFANGFVNLESLRLLVTEDGMTTVDVQGNLIKCAMTWKDLGGFEDFVVSRLIS